MRNLLFMIILFSFLSLNAQETSVADELTVKRENNFEFAQKPEIKREGDNFTITFETKAFCDVTVVVEDSNKKIIRHLISGVLGPKAPAPLQKNSKKQTVVWDSKNDAGTYVDYTDSCTIRVSLGLKPQFERTLFWSPRKRVGHNYPVIAAGEEGVYIAETYGMEQCRLFDHQGNYIRTVYPFPRNKLDAVKDLKNHKFIQDGIEKPLKTGYVQATLLTTSDLKYKGLGISTLATFKNQLAITGMKMNSVASDSSTGGHSLYGPQIAIKSEKSEVIFFYPRSSAFSPDGKTLYFTGYNRVAKSGQDVGWVNVVTKMDFDSNEPPALFAGDFKQGSFGKENDKFDMATSVDCDAAGRVYVSDYINERIQIFSPDGKFLKSIPTARPAKVQIHKKTGDIYVFSYLILKMNHFFDKQKELEATMSHYGPFDKPDLKQKLPLPLISYSKTASWNRQGGVQHQVELDSWAEKLTIWILNGHGGGINYNDDGSIREIVVNSDSSAVLLLEEEKGKLVQKRNFADDIKKEVIRANPPILWRQRLVTNPANGKLYVLEGDSGVMKSVNNLIEITPETGEEKIITLPLGAEDICFDIDGYIYIRTDTLVVRYDTNTWKEIPFDYGVERTKHSYGMGANAADIISGLETPGHRSFNFWQLGGIDVNVKGEILVTTCNGYNMRNIPEWQPGEAHFKYEMPPYQPENFEGRMRWGELHIWDKHGKLIKKDVVPGIGHLNGVGLDQDSNVYMFAVSRRIINGKKIDPTLPSDNSGTIIKVAANKNRVLSEGKNVSLPLSGDLKPKRSIDIQGYTTGWVEGAEWFYGGIGFATPQECICWNSRFTKDLLNRSIAPETMNYSVAVIDSAGNLITRIGKYGNIEDGKPLIAKGGPENTNSIGGDEVGLFYACYVASHTDKRIFIADAGNMRIVSVKLNYHTEEKLSLK